MASAMYWSFVRHHWCENVSVAPIFLGGECHPSPLLNADADAAAIFAVIHCRPCHLDLIVASAIFPRCSCLAVASLLPLSTANKYHSLSQLTTVAKISWEAQW
jgi:hypothetical protein